MQVFADSAVHGSRRGEIGNQLLGIADFLGQRDVGVGVQKVHMHITQTGQKTLQRFRLELRLGHEFAQSGFDDTQVVGLVTRFAGQRENAGIGVQQLRAIELIQRWKQLAQCQVAQGAKEGKGA